MELNDGNRLKEFRQPKREIRGSACHLVAGMDVAKDSITVCSFVEGYFS
jgi:hypothetical protein